MRSLLSIDPDCRQLIEAVAQHYSSVLLVNIDTRQYQAIKLSQYGHKIMNQYPDDNFDYYITNTVAPDFHDVFRRFVDTSTLASRLASQPVLTMEFRSLAEGRNWCRATFSLLSAESRLALLTFEDIHRSKEREFQIEQQMKYINGLFSGYDVVLVYNVDTEKLTYSYVCDIAPDNLRLSLSSSLPFTEMFASAIHSFCHPDHVEQILPYTDPNFLRQVLKSKKRHTQRFLYFNTNVNDYKWIELKLIKFASTDQPATDIAITFTNVDADERLKRQQHAALEDVKSIIRASEMGIWHITLIQGKKSTMQADDTMRRLLAIDTDAHLTGEALYDAWFSRIDADALTSVNASVMKMITDGRDENTYLWHHPTLGPRYVRCGGTSQPIMGGHVLSGYHYDVTEQVLAEMNGKKLLQDALDASKEKSAFIHNMVHEIRNPLNAIMGFSELLAMPDGSWSQSERDEQFRQITNAYNMLKLLIDDVIDAADAEHGNYIVNISDVNVNDVCRTVIQGMEFRKPGNVRLYFTTEVADDYVIQSDSRRICQILANYISNSCKHTIAGEIRLHVSTTERPGHITFSVTDTGEGIPPEAAQDVFKRFKKYNSNVKGSGIGLNIVSVLADKLNGQVCLDTTYTRGARFLFIL